MKKSNQPVCKLPPSAAGDLAGDALGGAGGDGDGVWDANLARLRHLAANIANPKSNFDFNDSNGANALCKKFKAVSVYPDDSSSDESDEEKVSLLKTYADKGTTVGDDINMDNAANAKEDSNLLVREDNNNMDEENKKKTASGGFGTAKN